ncbi:MAG TPA: peroxiredoxin [Streptosporangiaceae bacterium]|nr:peroxiredoxin [Streptosporangiaceae bacterium]
MARTPEIGQAAPDFTLPGVTLTDGNAVFPDFTLSAQRGSPLVLAFYPGDNTAVCTRQLCSYTSGLEEFTNFGATVWAISPQGLDSHEQFARKYGLAFPLLADQGLKVSRQYGITLGGAGLRRSVFVIDSDGVVRWKHVTLVGLTFPSAEAISAQLAAIGAS